MDLTNKTCFLVGLGRSIEELERRIEEFKNFDVVWCGMSSFDIPQIYILNKINKHFIITFDTSTVAKAEQYELTRRIPRLSYHLDTYKDSIYMTTNSDKNNNYMLRQRIAPEFNQKYRNQIMYTEEIGVNASLFCVSIHLFIACLYKMGCKEIVLFGQDGDSSNLYNNRIESYYKHELVKEDKIIGGADAYNLVGDTNNVNASYDRLMMLNLGYVPRPLNCSPNSTFTVFKTINYDELLNYLKNE
jgi:hypothetical protein